MTLLYMVFSCVVATFPDGVLGQVWFLIISIPDMCLIHYLKDVDYCFCFSTFQYIIFMVILLLGEIAGGIYVALEKGTVSIMLFPHLFVAKCKTHNYGPGQ